MNHFTDWLSIKISDINIFAGILIAITIALIVYGSQPVAIPLGPYTLF